jgi:hypothetical protein
MNFRDCDYYEKSMKQNHCPFDKICEYDCYFVYKLKADDYDKLLEDYRNLEDWYYDGTRFLGN